MGDELGGQVCIVLTLGLSQAPQLSLCKSPWKPREGRRDSFLGRATSSCHCPVVAFSCGEGEKGEPEGQFFQGLSFQ